MPRVRRAVAVREATSSAASSPTGGGAAWRAGHRGKGATLSACGDIETRPVLSSVARGCAMETCAVRYDSGEQLVEGIRGMRERGWEVRRILRVPVGAVIVEYVLRQRRA